MPLGPLVVNAVPSPLFTAPALASLLDALPALRRMATGRWPAPWAAPACCGSGGSTPRPCWRGCAPIPACRSSSCPACPPPTSDLPEIAELAELLAPLTSGSPSVEPAVTR